MLRVFSAVALLVLALADVAHAQGFFIGQANGTNSTPSLAFTSLTSGSTSSTTTGSGTYTVAAPSGLTSATYGSGCSGSSTVSGFSASGGNWSATFTTPSSGCTGTLTVTGTGSNTASATSPSATFSSSGNVAFTPLHTYFISSTGCSDSNNGTSTSTPWCTPNHNVVCGDVILVNAGDYSSTGGFSNWGTVSTCPSTTGGIDTMGGIYFAVLLCAGSDLEACTLSTNNAVFDIPVSNWAIEGWKVNSPNCTNGTGCGGSGTGRGVNCNGNAGLIHHCAAINNVFFSVASAFHTDDGGVGGAGIGADYTAAVGNIGVKASMNTANCEAAFDIVGPGQVDTNVGTHHYLYNNYTWNNNAGTGCNVSDSESFMFDTWDANITSSSSNIKGVVANNISWNSKRFCFNLVGGNMHAIDPTMKIYNNTCFHNNVATAADGAVGEINFNYGQPWPVSAFNNIAYQTLATSSGGGDLYALVSGGGLNSGLVIGGAGIQNIWTGSDTNCAGTCNATNDVAVFNGNSLPTGIFHENPLFTNTTDLLNNQSGNTPSCTGFINTTLCMGYNPATSTLTTPSVISDLQASCTDCGGKGFQLPSTTCATNADYPSWLKGIVYLRPTGWTNGATITENVDLVSKPCSM